MTRGVATKLSCSSECCTPRVWLLVTAERTTAGSTLGPSARPFAWCRPRGFGVVLPEPIAAAMEVLGSGGSEHEVLIERLLARLDAVFGRDRDLWESCQHAAACWGPRVTRPKEMRYRVPYVGPGYFSRRLVLVGMNSRDAGAIADEFATTAKVVQQFGKGSRDWGGPFHYRAASALAVVAAAQDRRARDDDPAPQS